MTDVTGGAGTAASLLAATIFQSLKYRINWKIYTPYADAAGMLLHLFVNQSCCDSAILKYKLYSTTVWQQQTDKKLLQDSKDIWY
jgi:hypothetical protein